jgi:hypothetical protein
MDSATAKAKVAELVGRRDALDGEIKRVQADYEKFSTQNLTVEARETKADWDHLLQRQQQITQQLNQLRKFW